MGASDSQSMKFIDAWITAPRCFFGAIDSFILSLYNSHCRRGKVT